MQRSRTHCRNGNPQKPVMYVLSSYMSDQKYKTIYYIIIKFSNFTEFTCYNDISTGKQNF